LRLALDMYEFGEQMQRARLRRLHPNATDGEIDAAIASWLLSRPGAPLGDAVGRPSHRFG
jgi:Rv0078B-related antitoxin